MSLNEILFALTFPVFSMHLKADQQQFLEQLDLWIEALKKAQFLTLCSLPCIV